MLGTESAGSLKRKRSRILNLQAKHKALIRFLLIAFLIYTGWIIISVVVIGENSIIEQYLTSSEAFLVSEIMTFIGYEGVHYVDQPPDASILYWGSKRLIGISDSCNGLVLFVTFTGFIIAFPASIKNKIWYIPFGIVMIYLLNVFRIFCLAIIWIYYPAYLDFNHHYTFTLFVYLDIFLLWMAFVKKFGDVQLAEDESKQLVS